MNLPFKAAVRPKITPRAAKLITVYESTFGSYSIGCCPEALAAVLRSLAAIDASPRELLTLAAELTGQSFP